MEDATVVDENQKTISCKISFLFYFPGFKRTLIDWHGYRLSHYESVSKQMSTFSNNKEYTKVQSSGKCLKDTVDFSIYLLLFSFPHLLFI